MHIKTKNFEKLVLFFMATAFGIFVSTIIFNFNNSIATSDINNYVNNFNLFSAVLSARIAGFFDLFRYEVFFYVFYEWLSELLGDPLEALRLLTLLASITMFMLAAKSPGYRLSVSTALFALSLLGHPIILDMLSSQQRSALALGLIALALKSLQSRYLANTALLLISAIHLSSLVILVIYNLYFISNRFEMVRRSYQLNVFIALFSSFLFVAFKDIALSLLGVEKAGGAGGFLYSAMWAGLLALLVAFNGKRIDVFLFIAYSLLSLGVISFFFNDYSSRFFAQGLIFYGLSTVRPRNASHKAVLYSSYIFTLIISYLYWLG